MKRCSPPLLRSLALGLVTVLAGTVTAHAANWYMVQGNISNQTWNDTASSASFKYWANSPSVTDYVGSPDPRYATAMDPLSTYYVQGTFNSAPKAIRTGQTGANLTFAGGKLVLIGTHLGIRSTGVNTAYVGHVEAQGASFRAYSTGINNFSAGLFEVTGSSASTFEVGGSGDSNRTHNVAITTLSGSGDLAFSNGTGGGTGTAFTVSIGNASAYTGDLILSSGTLTFTSALTANSLILNTGTFNLTNNITVSSLSVAGTAVLAGTYTAADLEALTSTNLNIAGGALLTVSSIPEPSTSVLALGGLAGLVAFCQKRRR